MADIERLVQEFADNVAAQTDAIGRGDHKTGNKCANRYMKALKSLRSLGDAGREGLLPLLHDDRADVRVNAAAFLLRYRTQEAREVLEREAAGLGFAAFVAGQALKRWEERRDDESWALDPDDRPTDGKG